MNTVTREFDDMLFTFSDSIRFFCAVIKKTKINVLYKITYGENICIFAN